MLFGRSWYSGWGSKRNIGLSVATSMQPLCPALGFPQNLVALYPCSTLRPALGKERRTAAHGEEMRSKATRGPWWHKQAQIPPSSPSSPSLSTLRVPGRGDWRCPAARQIDPEEVGLDSSTTMYCGEDGARQCHTGPWSPSWASSLARTDANNGCRPEATSSIPSILPHVAVVGLIACLDGREQRTHIVCPSCFGTPGGNKDARPKGS